MRERGTDIIIAELLRAERVRAGLTQARLADALGAPQSFVAKLENGERRLLLLDAIAVSDILGFDLPTFCQKIKTSLKG